MKNQTKWILFVYTIGFGLMLFISFGLSIFLNDFTPFYAFLGVLILFLILWSIFVLADKIFGEETE